MRTPARRRTLFIQGHEGHWGGGGGGGLEVEAELVHRGESGRTVQAELRRLVAKRMGATPFETDSSHVPSWPNSALCST